MAATPPWSSHSIASRVKSTAACVRSPSTSSSSCTLASALSQSSEPVWAAEKSLTMPKPSRKVVGMRARANSITASGRRSSSMSAATP